MTTENVAITISDARKLCNEIETAARHVSSPMRIRSAGRSKFYVPRKAYWEINDPAEEYNSVREDAETLITEISDSMFFIAYVEKVVKEANKKRDVATFGELENAENALRILTMHKKMLNFFQMICIDSFITEEEFVNEIKSAKEFSNEVHLDISPHLPEEVYKSLNEVKMNSKGAIITIENALALHNSRKKIDISIPDTVVDFCTRNQIIIPGMNY